MKLTNTQSMKRKSGMTLLELTVVILVLLSLISILFIGARAWKKGSDRAGCILNIRNAQQAVRGFQNMHSDAIPTAGDVFGTAAEGETAATAGYMKEPVCPSDKDAGYSTSYKFDTTSTDLGHLFLECQIDKTDHKPLGTEQW